MPLWMSTESNVTLHVHRTRFHSAGPKQFGQKMTLFWNMTPCIMVNIYRQPYRNQYCFRDSNFPCIKNLFTVKTIFFPKYHKHGIASYSSEYAKRGTILWRFCVVCYLYSNVSEEHAASFFRVCTVKFRVANPQIMAAGSSKALLSYASVPRTSFCRNLQ